MSCEKKECKKVGISIDMLWKQIYGYRKSIKEIESRYEREIIRLEKDLEKALQTIEDKDRVIIRLSERFAMKPE